jgi:hypothetical protein
MAGGRAMEEATKSRLLLVAEAQRKLSIGLGLVPAVIVGGGIAIAVARGQGRDVESVAQVVAVFVVLYIAAATYHLSGALEQPRGMRITLTVAALFVPFACLFVPLMLLWKARRALRAEAINAGFFWVRRAEMEWLRAESGEAMVCSGCGYDLSGIGVRKVCPECGRERV